ncbi:MAG TPA: UDP-2,4-diacetamido-2,4,6-trideoxy-beta-L-altropyranose hydrolase [Bacillota bacterium]|nr:UDP-2,4-diacetamido-2,4,6-trideoxy-beta-L-altropyranose hydrolase [Bacillota bacterium]
MKVTFRVDSSLQIGTGHVMRCLTLARELMARGHEISFICRELPGNIAGGLAQQGMQVYLLPPSQEQSWEELNHHSSWLGVDWRTDAVQTSEAAASLRPDWLVVDHYALDYRWQQVLRPQVAKILVIDDLADRNHACDLLLDQNLYVDSQERYLGLVSEDTVRCLGPEYVLLRPEFREARQGVRLKDGHISKLGVFMGGSDVHNITLKVLMALESLQDSRLQAEVILGSANPHQGEVEEFCAGRPNLKVFVDVKDMAQRLLTTDLVIGAGGSSCWERCCLGVPSLLLSLELNQQKVAADLQELGLAIYLGDGRAVTADQIKDKLNYVLAQPVMVAEMAARCLKVCDGTGAAKVAGLMEQIIQQD